MYLHMGKRVQKRISRNLGVGQKLIISDHVSNLSKIGMVFYFSMYLYFCHYLQYVYLYNWRKELLFAVRYKSLEKSHFLKKKTANFRYHTYSDLRTPFYNIYQLFTRQMYSQVSGLFQSSILYFYLFKRCISEKPYEVYPLYFEIYFFCDTLSNFGSISNSRSKAKLFILSCKIIRNQSYFTVLQLQLLNSRSQWILDLT